MEFNVKMNSKKLLNKRSKESKKEGFLNIKREQNNNVIIRLKGKLLLNLIL